MSRITPFNRPTISKKDLVNVLEAMIEDKLSEGELTKKFELAFAIYLKVKDSLFVNSAQSALFLILKHLKFNEGDEVLISAYSDPAIVECLFALKLTPILVDLEEKTFLMDKNDILKKKTNKTKAVIVSHAFGYIFPVTSLDFLQDDNIKIIEDCRYSLGSKQNEEHTGLIGDYAFFAFSPNHIITTGEGGAIITKVKKHLLEIRDLRSYKGQDNLKGRLYFSPTDIQAALGLAELSLIEKFITRRKEIGFYYKEAANRGKNTFISQNENIEFNYSYFPLELHSSLKIAKEMFKKYNIQAMSPIKNPLYDLMGLPAENFPNTLNRHLKTLCVPIYPVLSKLEIESIGKLITNIR